MVHEAAIALKISTEDGGELTFKNFLGHNAPPFVGVLNRTTQDVDFRRSAKIRWEPDSILLFQNRFRSVGIGESEID